MGSKVSGKMAVVGRVVQVVRPHAPLIKFPNRQKIPRPKVQEALTMAAANVAETSHVGHSSPLTTALGSRPPGLPSRVPGTPDSAATVRDFPQRFRRKALPLEEMDYIQRGGPE